MTDLAWIDAALTSARPQAVGALLRYFRDLDTAEEAYQEACLRALKTWPEKGPPRDPASWLIMVGRNAALDGVRRKSRLTELPPEDAISDTDDVETPMAERLDGAHYRDDILRLMFICCHPDLPATQQIALALRIVSGLSVKQIARAFLVGEAAMEQRITRAKARIAKGEQGFETPGPVERAERLAGVASMVYLVFNEGYSAGSNEAEARARLSEEAIRLGRLLLRLYQTEPEIMGLLALMLLQHARSAARFDADGAIVLLEDQDRSAWNRDMIGEGVALIDKAMRHRRAGPYQIQAAIAATHARAARPEDTDWANIDSLYQALELLQPSPVITLNRAVAVSKARGPAEALAMIEPLAEALGGYFYFFGAQGAFLLQLGRGAEAKGAFDRAISLANTAAEAAHIRGQIDRLTADAAKANGGTMAILRSIAAVLAGLIFIVAASTCTDLALEHTVLPQMNSPHAPAPLLALALAYRTLYGVIGGWLTAKIAPSRPVAHALVLGAIGTAAAIAGVVVAWSYGNQWYPLALVVLALPECWLGARLAARR